MGEPSAIKIGGPTSGPCATSSWLRFISPLPGRRVRTSGFRNQRTGGWGPIFPRLPIESIRASCALAGSRVTHPDGGRIKRLCGLHFLTRFSGARHSLRLETPRETAGLRSGFALRWPWQCAVLQAGWNQPTSPRHRFGKSQTPRSRRPRQPAARILLPLLSPFVLAIASLTLLPPCLPISESSDRHPRTILLLFPVSV